jgi:hypothetical protein
MLSHTHTFTHKGFHTQRLLHTDIFTHRRFDTHRHFYTQKFLHRSFYTQMLVYTDTFTHRRVYTQTLLRAETGPVKSQFNLRFWRSNLISCESVRWTTCKSQFYRSFWRAKTSFRAKELRREPGNRNFTTVFTQ